MQRRQVRQLVWLLAVGVAAAGCEDPSSARESEWPVSIYIPGVLPTIAVGDTVTLEASASRCEFIVCPKISSDTAPARFRWQSLDPAVAEVDARGFVRARMVGAARIRATLLSAGGGQTGERTLEVVPHIATISIQLDRDTVKVGETVSVSVQARDEAGLLIRTASIRISYSPQFFTLGSAMGAPGDYVRQFHARATGSTSFTAGRDYVHQNAQLWTSATVVILPAGG